MQARSLPRTTLQGLVHQAQHQVLVRQAEIQLLVLVLLQAAAQVVAQLGRHWQEQAPPAEMLHGWAAGDWIAR